MNFLYQKAAFFDFMYRVMSDPEKKTGSGKKYCRGPENKTLVPEKIIRFRKIFLRFRKNTRDSGKNSAAPEKNFMAPEKNNSFRKKATKSLFVNDDLIQYAYCQGE